MKKIFIMRLIMSIVTLSIVLSGCKKDVVEKSNFTYLDKKYTLSHCDIINNGETGNDPSTYEYEISFTSSGLSFDEATQEYTGTGSIITISLYSPDPAELLPGLYTFDRFESMEAYSMDNGSVFIDYNSSNIEQGTFSVFKTGIVELSRRGSNYHFNLEFYTDTEDPANSIKISGFYSGSVKKRTPTGK
jgi:hypothetical protein